MKKIKKVLLVLGVAAFVMALIAGCGSSKTTSENNTISEEDKNYIVNLGYYNCDHMTAACIAEDTGIFDELGIKVNVTGNGKVPEAMAAGKMDVGYIGTEGLMRAYLKGSPIIVAANNHMGGSYYLVAANDIKNPIELVGKKMGIGKDPEKNSASWLLIANSLGIPLEGKNYETFEMADKDKFLALKTGQLAGYTCCDPWGSMAEYEKVGKIIGVASKLPGDKWGSCCVLSMNQDFVKEHPELAKKMIVAHSKAIEYIYTHPYKAAEIFAENYNVPVEVALMTIYRKTVAEGRSLTWELDEQKIQDEIAYELSVKTLEKAPPITEFVNTKLISEAGTDNFAAFIKDKVDPVFPIGMSFEDWKKKAAEVDGK
ncbi:ABC transporter substrate-binding subunit SaoX [Phosphitispora sp. TUW77]|uniref:ABC transporter substrate-binding subunit SaoX n=1 Tax=Phosphitispora sp. TUW77 TaxID=3152361 RepID=UPI003AB7BEC1